VFSGTSAGGASVSYHMLNPNAKGLFHKAIMHAGSALAPWGLADKPRTEAALDRLATTLGCSGGRDTLASCMRAKPVHEVMVAQAQVMLILSNIGELETRGVEPCFECESNPDAVIAKDPRELVRCDRDIPNAVPLLAGVNRNEGQYFFGRTLRDFILPDESKKTAAYLTGDFFVDFLRAFADPRAEDTAYHQQLLNEYFTPAELAADDFDTLLPGFVKMFGAFMVKNPTTEFAVVNARKAPTYLFTFDFVSPRYFTLLPRLVNAEVATMLGQGVSHADEILYQFDFFGLSKEASEMPAALNLVKLHVNFMKTGKPGFGAKKISYRKEAHGYLSINPGFSKLPDYVSAFRGPVSASAL